MLSAIAKSPRLGQDKIDALIKEAELLQIPLFLNGSLFYELQRRIHEAPASEKGSLEE